MTDNHYADFAREALARPSDFGWWGFDEMFDTWGFTGIAMHRDSDLLQISNYHSVVRDLRHDFGDDFDEHFQEVGLKHWAVGHTDNLCCRILNRSMPHSDITDDDVTDYFKKAVDIAISLREDYPVYDECDYSDRQWVAAYDWLKECLSHSSYVDVGSHVVMTDSNVGEIHYWLSEMSYYENYLDDGTPYYEGDMIAEAVFDLGFDKRETESDIEFWTNWEYNNGAAVARRTNRWNEEAGQLKMEFS